MGKKINGALACLFSAILMFHMLMPPISAFSVGMRLAPNPDMQKSQTPESTKTDIEDATLPSNPFAILENEKNPAQASDGRMQPLKTDRYIIKYKNIAAAPAIQDKLAEKDIQTKKITVSKPDGRQSRTKQSPVLPVDKLEIIVLDEPIEPAEFAEQLSGLDIRDDIEYIQPDYLLKLSAAGTDAPAGGISDFSEEQITLPDDDAGPEPEETPPEQTNGEDVVIAVLDTGADITHPDLQPHMMRGWNFVDDNNEVYSSENHGEYNHGTHVVGIVADTLQKYSSKARIMPLKVFAGGRAYTSNIIAAIEYAAANGAQVINCSFGSVSENPALEEVIASTGALVVCAAGNSRTDLGETPVYPANYDLPNILSVASVNADDGFSYFSNYGDEEVDIAALGREVMSTLPERKTGNMTGTSMSAALVSAAAAIVLTNEAMDAETLHARLVTTADQLSNLEQKVTGARRINIQNALDGTIVDSIVPCTPEDDFDVHGYQRTPAENWELFSASEIVKIESSNTHTLALASDGTVWAWGDNSHGQLGTGDSESSLIPMPVPGMTDIVDIAAGSGLVSALALVGNYVDDCFRDIIFGNCSLALKSDGTVYFWGSFLEEGTDNFSIWLMQCYSPEQIYELEDIKSVHAGNNLYALSHSGELFVCGLLESLYVVDMTWGMFVSIATGISDVDTSGAYTVIHNTDNSVSHRYMNQWTGSTWYDYTPGGALGVIDSIPGLTGIKDVSAGGFGYNNGDTIEFGLALKTDGAVWSWGNNDSGQLGNGSLSPPTSTTPTLISSLIGVSSISAGNSHALALKIDGTVVAWGDNTSGQCGVASSAAAITTPTTVPGLSNIVYVNANADSSFAIDASGNVWAWGDNTYGQLGDGTTTNQNSPILVFEDGGILPPPAEAPVIQLAGAASSSLTIDVDFQFDNDPYNEISYFDWESGSWIRVNGYLHGKPQAQSGLLTISNLDPDTVYHLLAGTMDYRTGEMVYTEASFYTEWPAVTEPITLELISKTETSITIRVGYLNPGVSQNTLEYNASGTSSWIGLRGSANGLPPGITEEITVTGLAPNRSYRFFGNGRSSTGGYGTARLDVTTEKTYRPTAAVLITPGQATDSTLAFHVDFSDYYINNRVAYREKNGGGWQYIRYEGQGLPPAVTEDIQIPNLNANTAYAITAQAYDRSTGTWIEDQLVMSTEESSSNPITTVEVEILKVSSTKIEFNVAFSDDDNIDNEITYSSAQTDGWVVLRGPDSDLGAAVSGDYEVAGLSTNEIVSIRAYSPDVQSNTKVYGEKSVRANSVNHDVDNMMTALITPTSLTITPNFPSGSSSKTIRVHTYGAHNLDSAYTTVTGINNLYEITGLTPSAYYEVVMSWFVSGKLHKITRTYKTLSNQQILQSTIGTHVRLQVEQQQAAIFNPGMLDRIVARADAAYEQLQAFTGLTPYGGRGVDIRANRNLHGTDIELRYGINPLWSSCHIPRAAILANYRNNDVNEMVIHGVAGNFTLPKWDFDTNALAYLYTYYLVQSNNWQMVSGGYSNTVYTGAGLKMYYKSDVVRKLGQVNYDASVAIGKYSPYGMAYNLAKIADVIGWEPFEKAFAYMKKADVADPGTPIGRFNLLMTLLREYSGANVLSMFTTSEKAVYETRLGGAFAYVELTPLKAVLFTQKHGDIPNFADQHDSTAYAEDIILSLNGLGYNGNRYHNASPNSIQRELGAGTGIAFLRGHGGPGLMTVYENTTTYGYIFAARQDGYAYDSSYYFLEDISGGLNDMKLIYFGGCNTAHADPRWGSLPVTALNMGAGVVIAHNDLSYTTYSNPFMERLLYYAETTNGTLRDNIERARNDILDIIAEGYEHGMNISCSGSDAHLESPLRIN